MPPKRWHNCQIRFYFHYATQEKEFSLMNIPSISLWPQIFSLLPWLAIQQHRRSLTLPRLITPFVEKLLLNFKTCIRIKSVSILSTRNSFIPTQVMRLYSCFLCPQDWHSSAWKGNEWASWKRYQQKGEAGRQGKSTGLEGMEDRVERSINGLFLAKAK